jgi:thiol-disulfide isomerase/thioredoxin
MFFRSACVATAGFLIWAAIPLAAQAVPAPRVSVGAIDDLPVPGHPYDENADADRAVDAAFARAMHERKLVLIDLGGNWCPDCRILAGVMELPEVRAFLDAHFVAVSVDIGRFNKNLDIPARFGITGRLEGVPSVLIVTPDGRLLDNGHVAALADARTLTPQAIADWLAQWAR